MLKRTASPLHCTALSPGAELDGMVAESRYQVEVEASGATGEGVFDPTWALEILEQAMSELRAEENDPARFDLMAQTLTGVGDWEALMIATGLSEGSLKVAIHRFRERLRSLVAETQSMMDGKWMRSSSIW